MRVLFRYICLIGLVLGWASCSSTRKVQQTPRVGELAGEAYVEKAIAHFPSWDALSGKVLLQLGSKEKKNAKVTASFRLKRDQLIRLSVAPILGIEMARLDISPEGLLLIDRMNKRYVQLSFGEIREQWKVDLSFGVLQSLFLNEIFFPGKAVLTSSDTNLFSVDHNPEHTILHAKTGKGLRCHFRTSESDASLLETIMEVRGGAYGLRWGYQAFKPLNGRNFPEKMGVILSGASIPLSLDMTFSRLSVGGDWDTTSEVSSRYKRISIKEVLEILVSR